MRFAWLGAGAALYLIVTPGCSSNERVDGSPRIGATRQRIQGGAVDSTHKYAVGVASNTGSICSGALIAPNVVVTARHCVQAIDYKNPQVPKTIDCTLNPVFTGSVHTMYVTTKTSIDFNSLEYSVKQVVLPQINSVCNNDIALLVLNNLVSSSVATPIVPGVQYPINYSKFLSSFTAIGYGSTSATSNDAGTRHILQLIRIQCIPGDENVPCPAEIPENEFVAGDGTCGGDSGSSAFEQGSFSQINAIYPVPMSFGVLSRGGQDETTCVGSIYTRLDKFRDLIINTVTSASNNWALYPKPVPDWTVYVPPEVKDAGAPKPDAGKPTTTVPGAFGDACGADDECTSKLCGTEGACTTACEDSSTCPEGYDCRDAQCLTAAPAPTEAPAPGSSTTTTESCSSAPAGNSVPWGTVLLASAVAIGLGGRRRRRT